MKIPPNILLIICHDLGQRLGCYGVRHLKTPVLDALATKGVLCENYFATAPLCSPSRGSIMTGLYPHINGLMGLVNRGWDMPDTHPTLAQLLRGNGYATELFGGRCCSESEDPQPLNISLCCSAFSMRRNSRIGWVMKSTIMRKVRIPVTR